jgi:hypothetical protein
MMSSPLLSLISETDKEISLPDGTIESSLFISTDEIEEEKFVQKFPDSSLLKIKKRD